MARVPVPIEIKLPKEDLVRLVTDTTRSYSEYNEQNNLAKQYRDEAAKWTHRAEAAEAAASAAWAQTQAKAKAMADEILASEQPIVEPEDPTAPGFVETNPPEAGGKKL